jgi:hypothetical protein
MAMSRDGRLRRSSSCLRFLNRVVKVLAFMARSAIARPHQSVRRINVANRITSDAWNSIFGQASFKNPDRTRLVAVPPNRCPTGIPDGEKGQRPTKITRIKAQSRKIEKGEAPLSPLRILMFQGFCGKYATLKIFFICCPSLIRRISETVIIV